MLTAASMGQDGKLAVCFCSGPCQGFFHPQTLCSADGDGYSGKSSAVQSSVDALDSRKALFPTKLGKFPVASGMLIATVGSHDQVSFPGVNCLFRKATVSSQD